MFKYDTHVHTSDVSRCALMSAGETVRRYIDAGYTGLCFTNHYSPSYFDSLTGSWREKADKFLSGYRNARDAGGLDILLGAEILFDNGRYGHNDYLLFGLTEEIVYDYPELHRLTFEEMRSLADEKGMLIIQAHPMRDRMQLLELDLLDGMEVYNGNQNHVARNEEVARFARKRSGYIMTSGSDCHEEKHVARGGILSPKRLGTSQELAELLKSGDYKLICPFDPMTV